MLVILLNVGHPFGGSDTLVSSPARRNFFSSEVLRCVRDCADEVVIVDIVVR